MKLLIFACLLGFAAASFLEKAAPAVDDAVLAFHKGASAGKSLRESLGIHDPMFDTAGNDIKSGLGKILKQTLEEFLKGVKDTIDHGKEVSQEILEKVKDFREKLKDLQTDLGDNTKELLNKIKKNAKELLRSLLKNLENNLDKRNFDHQMDSLARMKFLDFVDKFHEKLVSDESIQKIREYIRKLESEDPVLKKLKEAVEKLHDTDLKEIIHRFFEHKTGSKTYNADLSIWNKFKIFFKELKVNTKDHFMIFGKWVKSLLDRGIDKLMQKHRSIRGISMEFISEGKDLSSKVAREALEFFRPYEKDLGSLWKKIMAVAKESIGNF